jgi:hypothetical protein
MAPLGRDLPPAARNDLMASYGSPAHLSAMRDEYRALARSNAEARGAVLPRDLPVVVLSTGLAMAPGQADMILRAQAEHAAFAASFTHGRHRVIAGANHISLVTDPAFADEIVDEVRRLVRPI